MCRMLCQKDCRQRDFHSAECIDNQCNGCLPAIAEPGLNVCRACELRFRDGLLQLIQSWQSLDANLGRNSSYELRERVQGTADVGLVLNQRVMNAKSRVREWAVFAVRILVTEMDVPAPKHDTVSLLTSCSLNAAKLLAHDLASDFVGDVTGLVHAAHGAVAPTRRSRFSLSNATCHVVVDGVECGASVVVAKRYLDGKPVMTTTCRGEAKHVSDVRNLILDSGTLPSGDMKLSAREAALLMGVQVSVVSVYAKRYAWSTASADGRNLYELSDVRTFLEKKND